MQINLKNKKYSVKLISSIIWVAFLVFFWNDTYSLLEYKYKFFQLQKTPFLINIISYSIWCLAFIIPHLGIHLFFRSFSVFTGNSSIQQLIETPYSLILKGILRGAWNLLIILFFITLGLVFTEPQTTILKDIVPIFTDILPSPGFNTPIGTLNKIYIFVVFIPFAFAIILPKLFLMLISSILQFPLLGSALITLSILYSFWQRFEARKYYQNLDLKGNNEPIKLTDKEYELLTEAVGGKEKLKKELEMIRKITNRQKK